MTLIAAWKTPIKGAAYDLRGIRLIADAMLSDGNHHPITPEWTKVHVIRPRVQVPISSCDEDWSEGFNHWAEHFYKRFGLFFAGAWLPFSFVKDRVREAVENLGLRAVYTGGECGTYVRTDIVRQEMMERFTANESIYGGHFQPPPPVNLGLIAKIVAEEFQRFYAGQSDGVFVIAPGHPNHGTIRYHALIGIAGYCEASKQFRIFQLTPEEDISEDGLVKAIPKITISEIADGDLLLFGSQPHQEAIRAKINSEHQAMIQEVNEVDGQTLARQAVIENEILSGSIPGVGGAVVRAEVDSEYGFQLVKHPWRPAEKLAFIPLEDLV